MAASGAPLGETPLGFGEFTEAPTPPTVPSSFVRYINPATGDFEIDPNTGHLQQMPAVRQRVLIALTARRGSSTTLTELGIQWGGTLDRTAEYRLRAAVTQALADLIAEPAIFRLDSIDFERTSLGRARVTVNYTDKTQRAPTTPFVTTL